MGSALFGQFFPPGHLVSPSQPREQGPALGSCTMVGSYSALRNFLQGGRMTGLSGAIDRSNLVAEDCG